MHKISSLFQVRVISGEHDYTFIQVLEYCESCDCTKVGLEEGGRKEGGRMKEFEE